MTITSVRFLLATQALAALLAISMLCAGSAVHAADEVPAAAAAPAAKAGPAGDPDFDDERLTDSELGRAVGMLRKDPRKAAAMLEDLAPKMPWLDDVIAYYTALARGRSDRSDGRKDFEKFLTTYPDSILRGDAAAELARLIEADADSDRAVSLAERYGLSGPDSGNSAMVCLSAGRVLVKKDPVAAATYFQCARAKSPLSGAARSAYDEMVTLRRDHAELRPSDAQSLMAEARLLGREGRSEEQAAMLRTLLDDYPGSAVEGEAELAYGRNLGKTVSKAAGADFFEKRAEPAIGNHRAKLLYEAGTLRWNNDQNAEAIPLFNTMLAMKTGIGDEQQALYALGRMHDVLGHQAEAITFYGRAAALAKGATRAESAWRQGWVSYRAKDFDAAEKSFRSMAENAPRGSDTDGRADALYWQGRSLERLGRNEEARECFRQVLAEFPLGYYAAASEQRLGHRPGDTKLAVEPLAAAEMPPAAELAIHRAKTLREAGLVTLAARDLSARLAAFDASTRRAVLPALPSSGAYDAAFRIAVEMNDNGELSREEARPYFYPKAHAEIVEREAKKSGIDPLLVYSLMRQESAFSTTAVSSAKALGLMQMLEKTARRVAASSGLPQPDAEDLFDPGVNIRLSVRYLAELSKQFEGNTALVAAAYNAGETAAERWKDLAKRFDQDEMIEQISYRETRQYVKNILRNMRNYRSIYGTT